jgi:TfoX/Sxy family transcriptional regulator of competence genes
MAIDATLLQRMRQTLSEYEAILSEKKMFGGVSFMLNGNFACGLTKTDLVIRVGPERNAEALAQPHARPMDFTGRPMKGWVYISPEGYTSDKDLADWLQQGIRFALSLPPK